MQGLHGESGPAVIAPGETGKVGEIDFYGNCHIVVARLV